VGGANEGDGDMEITEIMRRVHIEPYSPSRSDGTGNGERWGGGRSPRKDSDSVQRKKGKHLPTANERNKSKTWVRLGLVTIGESWATSS